MRQLGLSDVFTSREQRAAGGRRPYGRGRGHGKVPLVKE
jgi:hypothetical protein